MSTRERVAAEAGVSPSTVSRALSGSPLIPESTRKKVEAAAQKIGYIPSLIGRSHYSGRSYRLGVVVPMNNRMAASEYFSRMVYGMIAAAEKRGYSINVIADNGLTAEDLSARVKSKQVDGLLMLNTRISDKRFGKMHKDVIPFVLIHNYVPNRPYLYAGCDSRPGMSEAFRYLKTKGCRSAAFVSGSNDFRDAVDRESIFNALASEYGFKVLPSYQGDFSRTSGNRIAAQMNVMKMADAVFCANDRMAFGLIEGLKLRDINVPKDLSIIGFDDQSAATLMSPKITTIENPFEEISSTATEILINAIEGKEAKSVMVSSRFLQRESA
ncbi:MAG: LacI family DNA-binding transcriptional regulator [Fibrobacteres bacterium]|nr:LacI family DNA-binding transcriptional regulator [Fibrobacterota bacterium]